MKTKLKKLTSVCLAVIMILGVLTVAPITTSAAEETGESVSVKSGDFEYEQYDDTMSIIGYSGNAANLTIPSEIDGYTVTQIGWRAFYGNTRLKSVTIPDTVTYIGSETFARTALSSVTIPDSVTGIDYSAFYDCKNLKSVTVPVSVTYIGDYAFGYVYDDKVSDYVKADGFTISGYTNSRADLYASDNGFKFVSLGEVSPFVYEVYDDDIISITGYNGKESNLTIPSTIDGYTVTEIGWSAFYGNTRLKSVTIPDTVTYIGGDAFKDCENLTSITIPDSVTYIGYETFVNTALSGITIPSSVTSIEDYAFADCPNLKSVTIPASLRYIGEYAFGYVFDEDEWEYVKADGFTISGYTNSRADLYASDNGFKFVSLGEVSPFLYEVYDDEISIIGYNGKETNLTIPSAIDGYTVEEIGWSAFYGNTRLKSVTIPDTVTCIDGYAFKDCENLTSITIPDSVTYIGYETFVNTALSSINIPDSVTSISEYAFVDCPNLKSVTIPASVTSIGDYAFGYIFDEDEWEYVKADSFTISGYTNSRADLYASDNGFKFVSLGEVSPFVYEVDYDDIITITGYNGKETNLTIPSAIDGYKVTYIGYYAFYGNTRLKSVTIPDTVKYINDYAFNDCENLASVTIPNSVTYIDEYAFADCQNLKSVTIPASVASIGECAFGYVYDDKVSDYVKAGGFTIYGYTNSEAEVYAKENGFKFVSLGTVSPCGYEVLEDGTASINKYRGSETNLTIPSEIDGYTVTEIGWNAFYGNTSLTSVTIPDTVEYIGGSSFQGCENLTSVTIPDSVTHIGYDAFENTALSDITIPASVQYINDYAFGYMYNEGNGDPEKVDGFTIYGYTNSEAEVYAKENGFKFVSLGTVSPYGYEVLEDGTASINKYRGSETNLTIPSKIDGYKVTQIGGGVFYGNENLKSVTIPDTVTRIGRGAFALCTSLADINIPDSVTYIGGGAFAGTKWYGNQPDGMVYAGGFAYAYKGEMPAGTTITLKKGTKGIVGGAFSECDNLKGITIPDSVKLIGETAFSGCTSLESVTIPDSVTVVDYAVFAECTNLKSVKISNNATSILAYAFSGCTSLESVTIPDSVSYIDWEAFTNCTSLKSITVPYSVKYIGGYAFGYIYNEDSYEYDGKVDGFTISGYTGSAAEKYAKKNGFTFVSLGIDPTPKLGDVNGDGSISIDDATAIQKYIANMLDFTDEQAEVADVNMDGDITIDDVTLVQKYLAGLAEI